MFQRFSSPLGTAVLALTGCFCGWDAVHAQHGHGGGHGGSAGNHGGHPGGSYHGGYYGGAHPYGHGGYYGPYHGYGRGYYPYPGYGYGYPPYYGFYRPYYGYGLGAYGFGLGLGYGLGGYGLGGYGLGGSGSYLPYYGGAGYASAPVGPNSFANSAPSAITPPPAENPPPPDNAAHLQLLVPENAEVVFDADRTSQKGAVREFVSPPLLPGKAYTYKIAVRYTDASGKPIDDRRAIHVRANDWFSIDFTRPEPSGQPASAPPPRPNP